MAIDLIKSWLGKLTVPDDAFMDDEEVDLVHSWNISSQLAALAPGTENQVPEEVAELIREARELHPKMAQGAMERAHAVSKSMSGE